MNYVPVNMVYTWIVFIETKLYMYMKKRQCKVDTAVQLLYIAHLSFSK